MREKPADWIDKLFICMSEFYGHRWKKQFGNAYSDCAIKTVWCNALADASYNQIKKALFHYRDQAKDPDMAPPTPLEFHATAKRHLSLIEGNSEVKVASKEVAQKHIAEMRARLKNHSKTALDGHKDMISKKTDEDEAKD